MRTAAPADPLAQVSELSSRLLFALGMTNRPRASLRFACAIAGQTDERAFTSRRGSCPFAISSLHPFWEEMRLPLARLWLEGAKHLINKPFPTSPHLHLLRECLVVDVFPFEERKKKELLRRMTQIYSSQEHYFPLCEALLCYL